MPSPIIYLIAGCNGAGKTIFAKEFLPSIGIIRFLNADEIARGLSPLDPSVVAFKAGRREAIRRVRQRVIEGGHDVPADDIRRRFARSIQHLLDDYASLADRWALWDNSTPPARLLANSSTHGIIDLRQFFANK